MRCVAPILCVAGACASAGIGEVESDDGAVRDAGGSVDAPFSSSDASPDGATAPGGPPRCDHPVGAVCEGIDGVVDVWIDVDTVKNWHPHVYPEGDGYVLTWLSEDDGKVGHVARMDACGALVGPVHDFPGRLITSIASSGDQLGMVSEKAGEPGLVRFERLALDGTPIDGSEVGLETRGTSASVAWDPVTRQWGAAWLSTPAGEIATQVRFARFDEEGTFVPDSTVPIGPPGGMHAGDIVWAGDRFAIPYGHDGFAHVDQRGADGATLTTHSAGIGAETTHYTQVAPQPGGYSLVTQNNTLDSRMVVVFVQFDDSGLIEETARVLADHPAGMPTIAWNGTEHAVAWYGGAGDVHMARLDAGGALLDSRVLTCFVAQDYAPDMTWSGAQHVIPFVRWDTTSDLHLLVLDP